MERNTIWTNGYTHVLSSSCFASLTIMGKVSFGMFKSCKAMSGDSDHLLTSDVFD